ncbi:MAG TPA: nucleoside-diphosphate sugar epimerase/dehydratase [Gemmatimonadaceae bacterium]|nr:nucleoside-diphosphate sugar epimerase/dehydratase [Gemmatimonadaceae bacterium]
MLRNRHLLALDALLLPLTPLVAYLIRFDGFDWGARGVHDALRYAALSVPLKLAIYFADGLYRRLWRFTDSTDAAQLVRSVALSAAACALLGSVALPELGVLTGRVPLSVLVLDAFLTAAVVIALRFLGRSRGAPRLPRTGTRRRVLIAGAGAAGEMIVHELRENPALGLVPIGFVDDDRRKHRHRLCALPVFGSLSEIPDLVAQHGVEEIIIAMPRAPGTVVRQVVRAAGDAGVPTRIVPAMFEILAGRVGVSSLRAVRIEDLLRRTPVETDLGPVSALVRGHTVLVTGAGGSIGSELCRQLARLEPARLVLLGHGENSIFEIQQELRARHPALALTPAIADVRDGDRIMALFARYRPTVVFHAAAHKHVPLMEDNVVEAVTTNVRGTRNVVDAAAACGVGQLVMISTDKAVHPSSVMGATKRAAELVVQQAAARGRRFMAVRFGNVLGSRGSVVPIFLRQIRAGGPVTITHPEMRRYFMTIPEAVQLVLQAGALGHGGEVFVLDMGDPVRIVDLASDLIRLSGLEVGADVDIEFVGMRPGEKLVEEVFFDGEHASPTHHPKVLRARNVTPADAVMRAVDALLDAAAEGCSDEVLRGLLQEVAPDFVPGGQVPEAERAVAFTPVALADRAPGRGVAAPPYPLRSTTEKMATPG